MTLELVNEKDCVGYNGLKRYEKRHVRAEKGRGTNLKKYSLSKKRCFNCGHNEGVWYEHLIKGRREYHYLCQKCIDIIEGR